MRPLLFGSAFIFTCLALSAGEVTIGFEGPPVQPPDTHYAMAQYNEGGYHFQPFGPLDTRPPYRMGRVGPRTDQRPDNGTTHLSLLYGDSCKVTKSDGATFDAVRVDLAEYSTVFPVPQTVVFTGRKADQTTVTATFITDGVIDGTGPGVDFQTFHFPDTFRDLVSLETDEILAYDNLVLRTGAVPPPRRFTADVSLSLSVRSETVPVERIASVRSTPEIERIGNDELLAFFVREGLIRSARGWRLVCSYNGRLSGHSPGPVHFEIVNDAGRRINVDPYLSLEPIAQVQRLSLINGTPTLAPSGEMVEERFYKLMIAGYRDESIVAYGRLSFVFVVRADGLAQFAKARAVEGGFGGHAGTFSVVQGKLSMGAFTSGE